MDRLAADPRDAGDDGHGAALRDQLTRPGNAHAHSQPAKEFPRDLHLQRLAPQRPLELAHLPAQLVGLGAFDLPGQALGAGGQELLAPASEQRF